MSDTHAVLRFADVEPQRITQVLAQYQLQLVTVAHEEDIPGSFWGDEEAGLIADKLYTRPDTPVHSICHEAGHYICMDAQRRATLDTTAEGDYDEENAVCYLQVLLGEHMGMSRERMFADMDAWGYSFRLGSSQRWFEEDAEDAQAWLCSEGLVSPNMQLLGILRR